MENQKNNKGVIALLIVIIVILSILCVLFATGTISFKNENINNQTNSNNQNNENIGENQSQNEIVDDEKIDWGTFLLSIHLLDANVEKFKYDSNGIRTSEGVITLSKEDLTSVLTNLQKDKIIKYYTMGTDLVINSKLTVSYENNDQKYTLVIYNNVINVEQVDDEFKKVLEDNVVEEENQNLKNENGVQNHYIIKNFNENIYDTYFNN